METSVVVLLILISIPFAGYGIRELLRIPRRRAGLPIAPEVLQENEPTRGQRVYWQFMHSIGMGTDLHREIARTGNLQPGETVMDIGAGTGELALLLKTVVGNKGKVSAIDINEHFLHRCRHRSELYGLEVEFKNGNAAKIPFPENTMDAVTCSLMAHHLTTDLKEKMFSEILRVLKPGGRMVFFDLAQPRNLGEWTQVLGILSLDLLFEWHCASVNLRGELPGMIERKGFEIAELRDYFMRNVRTQFIIGRKPLAA
jgi:SAM-dependent methyltransferase